MIALPVAASAVPIGIAFGLILERAGLGDPRVIRGQLVVRDFTVIRVMFGAIVTAMLLVILGGALGWIDPSVIAIPPTDLGAQALGAVIFGGGFALAALCPGTACVAAASGRRDGAVAVGGIFLGTLITPLLWPALGAAATRVPREGARLPDDLGWPLWVVVLGITLLAVTASVIARRVEGRAESRAWWRLSKIEAGALMVAALVAFVDARPTVTSARLGAVAVQITREEDHVDPLELAAWIKDRHPGLRVIDVRERLDSTAYMIPSAEAVPLSEISTLRVHSGDQLVLYSDGGTHAAQAWVLLRLRGLKEVWVLKDGLAAWEDEVLSPAFPPPGDSAALRRFITARALSAYFGGKPNNDRRARAPAEAERRAPSAAPHRRNTC